MVDNVLNNGFGEKERREEIRKAAESYQQKTGATITFFAAVCEEFPSMGNYFDGLTVEQVTDRYKQILADPRLSYMGNGMGFELHDSSLITVSIHWFWKQYRSLESGSRTSNIL